MHNRGTNKKLFVVLKSKTLRTTNLNKNCSVTIILFVLSLSCTTQMKKMVCACLGVGRGRNQPSQIRFVEKIKALECLSPSFYLPRALTPPTCLEEETRGGFKSGDLGGRELKEHHRTKDDPLIRREIKCNRMPSSFSRHDASYQPHGQALAVGSS